MASLKFVKTGFMPTQPNNVAAKRKKARIELNTNWDKGLTKHRVITESPLLQSSNKPKVKLPNKVSSQGMFHLEQLKKWKEARDKQRAAEKVKLKPRFKACVHVDKSSYYTSTDEDKYKFATKNHKFKPPSNIKPILMNKKPAGAKMELQKPVARNLHVETVEKETKIKPLTAKAVTSKIGVSQTKTVKSNDVKKNGIITKGKVGNTNNRQDSSKAKRIDQNVKPTVLSQKKNAEHSSNKLSRPLKMLHVKIEQDITTEENCVSHKTHKTTKSKNVNLEEHLVKTQPREKQNDVKEIDLNNDITKTPKLRRSIRIKGINLEEKENSQEQTNQQHKKKSAMKLEKETPPLIKIEEEIHPLKAITPKQNINTPKTRKAKKSFGETPNSGVFVKGEHVLLEEIAPEKTSSKLNTTTPKTRKRNKSVAFVFKEEVISPPVLLYTPEALVSAHETETVLNEDIKLVKSTSVRGNTPKREKRRKFSAADRIPAVNTRRSSPGKTPRRHKAALVNVDDIKESPNEDLQKSVNECNSADSVKSASAVFSFEGCADSTQNSTPNSLGDDSTSENKPDQIYVSPFVTMSRGKRNAREENTLRKSQGDIIGSQYFYKLLSDEIARLQGMCDHWETYKQSQSLPEEACNMINVPIGQSKLLITKKMSQFRQLIDQSVMDSDTEKLRVTCTDLLGFWDTISIQVDNLNQRFAYLDTLQANNWDEIISQKKPQVNIEEKKIKKRVMPSRASKQTSSKIRDAITAARKRHLSAPEMKEFNGGFFSVKSPMKDDSETGTTKKLEHMLLRTAVANRRSFISPGLAMMNATMMARSQAQSPFANATPKKSILKLATPTSAAKKSVIFQLPKSRILYDDEEYIIIKESDKADIKL